MIGIKKIEVASLDNYGKIINSFSTTDDKTTNAPSLNAVSTLVEDNVETINGQIETITDDIEQINNDIEQINNTYVPNIDFCTLRFIINATDLDTSKTISYPSGFNKTNTNVISVMAQKGSNSFYTTHDASSTTLRQAIGSGFRVYLDNDNIKFHILKGATEADGFTAHVKILLMKIDPNIEDYELGDINMDGKVDNDDKTLLTNYLNGEQIFTENQFKLADMNENGVVDSTDLLLLTQKIINS